LNCISLLLKKSIQYIEHMFMVITR